MNYVFTIDIGNTNQTVGVFKNNSFVEKISLCNFIEHYEKLIDHNIIISNVSNQNIESKIISKNSYTIFHDSKINHFHGMPINYQSTLGSDRLALNWYAYQNIANLKYKKILVIDSGTFSTVDFVNDQGHQGGYIFPGNKLLIDSYKMGERLKTFSENIFSPPLKNFQIPTNTKDAIEKSIPTLFQLFYQNIFNKYSPDNVLVTGGNSNFHKLLIDNTKTNKPLITLLPNLIHFSLFTLYNKQQSMFPSSKYFRHRAEIMK